MNKIKVLFICNQIVHNVIKFKELIISWNILFCMIEENQYAMTKNQVAYVSKISH